MTYREVFDTDNGLEIIEWHTEQDALDEERDGKSRAIRRYEVCQHCAQEWGRQIVDLAHLGAAQYEATWVDEEGEISEETYWVCVDCLTAGSPNGLGYRAL